MKLLEPLTIKGISFHNRVMFPPLTTGYEGRDGSISKQDAAFYTRLAKGGVSYIVLGDVAPVRGFTPTPKLYDDSQIESFKVLADSVHEYGAKIGVQIFHPEYNSEMLMKLFAEGQMDEVRIRMRHEMEHFADEVTGEELAGIIEKMCACAVRAQKAGIDVIQIHGDRLVGVLCGTRMNHRTDDFGGSLENRTRFALMAVRALREAVPDMVLDYKLSVVTPERGKGGVEADEAPVFTKWLEEAGVDMLHVAQANHTGNMADTIPPMGVQPYGFFVDIAGKVKEAVTIPVSTVGRIVDPAMAEAVLESGKADMIGLGRPLLADPDWVKKAENCPEDIRRCIYCNKGCTDNIQNRRFLACVLNAENGYEAQRSITPAAKSRRIAVIGGGPAGLEAARVAALKGNQVTLYEKEYRLGGQLNLACVPPRKEELRRALLDLEHTVRKAGVTLRLGEEAFQEQLLEEHPDTVIVAVGARSAVPPIPGRELPHVRDAWKVLDGKEQVYGRVAVIGGGMVGCETAEYLAEKGCKVSVVEMMDKIAAGESVTVLPTLMANYEKYGVEQYPSHKVERIETGKLVCKNGNDESVEIPCDYVVMAVGASSVAFPAELLEQAGIRVVRVGDCAGKAADIDNAVKTGYDAANAIE